MDLRELPKRQLTRHQGQQRSVDVGSELEAVHGSNQRQAKHLSRTQVHEMVRIQLELDGWDPRLASDAWIDDLFDRFDADNSGVIDDTEWDLLVPAMRDAMEELQFEQARSTAGSMHMEKVAKHLSRTQVHEMVRIQLELDGWDPRLASDAWIDDLFDRFDADNSGVIDDAEWDLLVPAMRDAMEELQKRGGAEAQPLRRTKMTTYGATMLSPEISEPEPELAIEPAEAAEATVSNAGLHVFCPTCHLSMSWGNCSSACDLCKVPSAGMQWLCEKCSRTQCTTCNPKAFRPPKLISRHRFKSFLVDRFEAESHEGTVQDFDEYHTFDVAAANSDSVEVRVHVHEAKELVPKDGSTSDPYVIAKCFCKQKKTSVAPAGTEAVFDEELQFVGTQADLNDGLLVLECWDKDMLNPDDLIGTCTFDLTAVHKRENKEYYKAWVALFNFSNSKANGEQGKLRVSVTILEPGDELPARPGQEISEDGDPLDCDLRVKIFRAEGLPLMNTGKNDLADPYISLAWETTKARTKVASNTVSPEWNEVLVMKVAIEQSVNAPPKSDTVLVRLREHNKSLTAFRMGEVSHAFLFLSDISSKQWENPCWLNFYGAVRPYDDPFLKKPPTSEFATMMNQGKIPGVMYRGRVLLSASLGSAHCDSELLANSISARKANALPKELPPFPATIRYCLKVAVVTGADLPERTALAVRVTWGLAKSEHAGTNVGPGRISHGHQAAGVDAWTHAESSADGMAQWDRLLTLKGEWPADLSQVPDIFIELIDTEEHERMYCLRIDVRHPFIRSSKDMVPVRRFGPPTLDCDWFDLQADSQYMQDDSCWEPQLLLSLGLECSQAPVNRAIKCPHLRDKLAVFPAEKQSLGTAYSEHTRWPVDDLMHRSVVVNPAVAVAGTKDSQNPDRLQRIAAAQARLKDMSLGEIRALAIAEGVDTARMQEATTQTDRLGHDVPNLHHTTERTALANLLLERLPDAAECQATFRCHVYQAKNIDVGFNSECCQLYVETRMWDVNGRAYTTQTETVTTSGRSAKWYETLELKNVTITGPNTRSIELRMAAEVGVAVYQIIKVRSGSLKKREAATMIGRMRVRLSTMEAHFEKPMWIPLRLPGTSVSAGELLVGFQLLGSDVPHPPNSILKPYTRRFDLDVVIVGARGLKDTAALLVSTVDESLVKYELDELEGKTQLAEDGAEDDPIGFADLNLADIIRAGQLKDTTPSPIGSCPEQNPELEPTGKEGRLGGLQQLKSKTNARGVAGYSLLPTEDDYDEARDNSTSDASDENEDTDLPVIGRYKSEQTVVYQSAAAAARTLGFSLKSVLSCCESESFRTSFRAKTGYLFKNAEEGRGKQERDPTWRVGRRKALNELELVHDIDAFATLALCSLDPDASTPGSLKVLITATERPENMGSSVNTRMLPLQSISTEPSNPPTSPVRSIRPCEVVVRLYAIRAFALRAKDAGNTSDPYVLATIDDADGDPQVGVWPKGTMVDGKDMSGETVRNKPVMNTLTPHFGQMYEWRAQLPGAALKVAVKDFDGVLEGGVDDEIGETTIDLENRFFSDTWRSLGVHPDGYDMKFPIEQRDLMGESGVTQGVLECWVETFPVRDMPLYPVMDISAPKRQKFELRVVVWNAVGMTSMDTVGGMNDLYITGALSYRDKNNKLKEKKQTTDIHWRSQNGKGSFNYRLIYKDLELPMTMPGAEEGDFPRFVVKAFDQDIIGGADMIGTAQVPEIKDVFKRAWRSFERQHSRDHSIHKMSVEQLRVEVQQIYDSMIRKTIDKLAAANSAVIKDTGQVEGLRRQQAQLHNNKEKVCNLPESKLREILMEHDPVRQLDNTAVKFPDPSSNWVQHKLTSTGSGPPRSFYRHATSNEITLETPAEGIQKQVFVDPSSSKEFLKTFKTAQQHDSERDKGIRMWDLEKQQQRKNASGGSSAGTESAGTSGASSATGAGGIWKRITGGATSSPGRFDVVVNLRGPNEASDSEEDETQGAGVGNGRQVERWTDVGKVFLQFELLPQALAQERECGHGRSEPNRFPELPPPVGRVKLSLNPFSTLSAFIGPDLTQKLCLPIGAMCCCVGLFALLVIYSDLRTIF